ncbi:hypothetical protein C9374_011797 [Naegleria lovaniensis]|uniref:Reverse transcriptase domain-containing protein n=1 Tax=Naegleria lovaniensis TaxID=51637 RepID=A0AA88GF37_NAELO|nr:uncharacterized protein C9374_011797 [Naegleria lovaniensis]KAG2373708.1 hypothetical protein C9374_011797 [Naegleria lovaniensis]
MSENQTALGDEDTYHLRHHASIKEVADRPHTANKSLSAQKSAHDKLREEMENEILETPSSVNIANLSVIQPSTVCNSPMLSQPEVSNITTTSGVSVFSTSAMTDDHSTKLKRHHKLFRVVAFTTNSVEEVLATVAMNADALYGSRVVSELECIILFFKSRKLANQAISSGAKSKLTMIPQTVKTSFRYKVDKDLDKTNMHSIISTLGTSINNINFSKIDDQEFWAIGTNIELPANHLKKFKLSKMRTDISRFRIAFNGKEKDLPKLKGAISSQWKVKIESIELANKVAVVGVKKDQITNNITKFVQVGNHSFRNLSFSTRVANSISHRMEAVEKQMSEMSSALQKLTKEMAVWSGKKVTEGFNKINKAIEEINQKVNALLGTTTRKSKSTANFGGVGWVKQSQLLTLARKYELDILNIQETHLKSSTEDYWNVWYSRSFFRGYLVYTSNATEGDNGAGIATIVKPSPFIKVLQFIEHIQGRLSEVILEHKCLGVVRIFNWYGPANKNKLEFMNKALNIINIAAQTAVLHGERIVILGDLNANTKTFNKVSYAAHERLLIDQCDKLKLFDVVPIPNTPSFSQRNKYSHGFSRPDHIITSHNDYSNVDDVSTAYSHKLLTISFPSNPILDFPEKFNKYIIHPKTLQSKMKEINNDFAMDNPSTLLEAQNTLAKIVKKYGSPSTDKPSLITDNRNVRQFQTIIFDLKQYLYKRKYVSTVTSQFLNNNFSLNNIKAKLEEAKASLNKLIGSLLADRKRVFVNRINNLSSKQPYSYAFRKELVSSSILNVVQSNHNSIIVDHFSAMFNTEQEVTKTLPEIKKNNTVAQWKFQHITAKELGKVISKTKNSMAGYDNISVPLLKILDNNSLQVLAKCINHTIDSEMVPKELGIGILLPLPKVNMPTKLSDFRPIVVLSVIYRLFSSIINKQFMNILEEANLIHTAQRGFMKKGSTLEHLINLRTALAYKCQHKQEVFAMALDIKNAYGSVIHKRFISILKKHGFRSSVINLLTSMISNSVMKVLVNGFLSSPFDANVGVPQGDPSSPAWFNLYINSSTNIQEKLKGVQIFDVTILLLLYADDILLIANTKIEMNSSLKSLGRELKKIGLALAPKKCKLLAITAKSKLSKALDNLSWSSDNPVNKISNRLASAKTSNLYLNSITTTIMSKIISLPRYACSFNGISKNSLDKADIMVANFIRKAIGLDYTLSKSVVFNCKQIGGLGITRPSILFSIEPICTAVRLFNSSSSITKNIALAAWKDTTFNEPFWNHVKNIAAQNNWSLQYIDERYSFVNEYETPVDPRTELLNSDRSTMSISGLGTLDHNRIWHPCTISFWNNYSLKPFQQRLLFAHLHKAEILRNFGKDYPNCHICNTKANWEHVFTSCAMCSPEIKSLYTKWDNSSLKFNAPLVRLPSNHSLSCIPMEWNGSIKDESLQQLDLSPPALTDWLNEIYLSFAAYVGSCYKNATWNSSTVLKKARGYIIKPKTAKFATAWETCSNQLGELNSDNI